MNRKRRLVREVNSEAGTNENLDESTSPRLMVPDDPTSNDDSSRIHLDKDDDRDDKSEGFSPPVRRAVSDAGKRDYLAIPIVRSRANAISPAYDLADSSDPNIDYQSVIPMPDHIADRRELRYYPSSFTEELDSSPERSHTDPPDFLDDQSAPISSVEMQRFSAYQTRQREYRRSITDPPPEMSYYYPPMVYSIAPVVDYSGAYVHPYSTQIPFGAAMPPVQPGAPNPSLPRSPSKVRRVSQNAGARITSAVPQPNPQVTQLPLMDLIKSTLSRLEAPNTIASPVTAVPKYDDPEMQLKSLLAVLGPLIHTQTASGRPNSPPPLRRSSTGPSRVRVRSVSSPQQFQPTLLPNGSAAPSSLLSSSADGKIVEPKFEEVPSSSAFVSAGGANTSDGSKDSSSSSGPPRARSSPSIAPLNLSVSAPPVPHSDIPSNPPVLATATHPSSNPSIPSATLPPSVSCSSCDYWMAVARSSLELLQAHLEDHPTLVPPATAPMFYAMPYSPQFAPAVPAFWNPGAPNMVPSTANVLSGSSPSPTNVNPQSPTSFISETHSSPRRPPPPSARKPPPHRRASSGPEELASVQLSPPRFRNKDGSSPPSSRRGNSFNSSLGPFDSNLTQSSQPISLSSSGPGASSSAPSKAYPPIRRISGSSKPNLPRDIGSADSVGGPAYSGPKETVNTAQPLNQTFVTDVLENISEIEGELAELRSSLASAVDEQRRRIPSHAPEALEDQRYTPRSQSSSPWSYQQQPFGSTWNASPTAVGQSSPHANASHHLSNSHGSSHYSYATPPGQWGAGAPRPHAPVVIMPMPLFPQSYQYAMHFSYPGQPPIPVHAVHPQAHFMRRSHAAHLPNDDDEYTDEESDEGQDEGNSPRFHHHHHQQQYHQHPFQGQAVPPQGPPPRPQQPLPPQHGQQASQQTMQSQQPNLQSPPPLQQQAQPQSQQNAFVPSRKSAFQPTAAIRR